MRAPRLLRRTTFAASLVVTIGATAACGGKSQPYISTNPPPVDERPGQWKQVDERWVYAYDDGDEVWVGDDGQCRLVQADHCGPEMDENGAPVPVSCNPPPPQDVECPPGKP